MIYQASESSGETGISFLPGVEVAPKKGLSNSETNDLITEYSVNFGTAYSQHPI